MHNSLARKHLFYVLACSTFFAAIITCYQLYVDFEKDVSQIHDDLAMIEKSYIPSIVSSLYNFDSNQLKLFLDGIVKLRDIEYIEVLSPGVGEKKPFSFSGDPKASRDIFQSYPLIFSQESGVKRHLGILNVYASLEQVKSRLFSRILVIVGSNLIKTFLMAICILYIIQILTVRHLKKISDFASQLDIDSLDQKIVLERKNQKDELDEIVDAINTMIIRIKTDVDKINKAGKTHKLLNEKLENQNTQLNDEIVERKLAEEGLRNSEEKYRDLFDKAPNAYISVNAIDGRILNCNETALNMFGYDKRTLMEMPMMDLYADTPDDLSRVQNVHRSFKAGEVIRDAELQVKHKDGHLIWISLSVDPILDNNGKTIESRSVIIDISQRIELESRLRQSHKMEAIGYFAGGIAHDFNNILWPIIGYSEILLQELSSESENYENAQQILLAGKRARDLVRQILSFSRQSEQKIIQVSPQRVLKDVLKLGRKIIPSNIEIIQEIESNCGLVMMDPTQLHQIIMNLITNAYHAVELSGGSISVVLKEAQIDLNNNSGVSLDPGDYVMIIVSDTGCGMEPSIINKIFEPYFTTKKQGKGTGLGLAVVYGIVKEYNGEIKVESQLGEGTIFTVYLPRLNKIFEIVNSEKKETSEGGNERIMLVDDDGAIVELQNKALERVGYRVTPFTDSIEALKVFQSRPDGFDLVITDMTMPNMTGDQFSKALIDIRADIPIIMCTGFSDKISKESSQKMGIKGFLMKPITFSDILHMVRKVLDEEKEAAH